jgi:DNA polymerase (family 10)
MATLDAAAVAALLVELGRRTALAGDNYFRAKAYLRAADTLSALVEPLDRVIAENRLRQLPGIGETIADTVTKLHNPARTLCWKSSAGTSRKACSTCSRFPG